MTYAEKLLDPRWQRRRLEILSGDNFACRRCKSTTRTLHVHHRYYITGREPWEYPDIALETLCKDCHAREPAPGARERAWLEKAHIWFEGYHPHDDDLIDSLDAVIESAADAGFFLSDVANAVDNWITHELGIYLYKKRKAAERKAQAPAERKDA